MTNQFLSPLNADLFSLLGIDTEGLEPDEIYQAIYDKGTLEGYRIRDAELALAARKSMDADVRVCERCRQDKLCVDTDCLGFGWLTDEEELSSVFSPQEPWREVA